MAEQQIVPGTVWLDGKPSVSDPCWRRVVRVDQVDFRYVHAVGWWQQQVDGQWQDSPQTSRKTRVLHDAFQRQYSRLEG